MAARLNQTTDLRLAALEILDQAVEGVCAERATLFLLDDTSGCARLSVCVSRGKDQGVHKEKMRSLCFDVDGTSIAGSVAMSGAPILVADAYEDARFNREVDRKTGFRTRSIACVPLCGAPGRGAMPTSNVVGVLQAVNRVDGKAFSAVDLGVLSRFAAVGGALVQRLRLVIALQEARRRSEELLVLMRDIPAQAAEGGVGGAVRAIIRTAYRMMECERVTVMLVDKATGNLVIQESKDATGVVVGRGKGIAGDVFTSGRLTNVADAHQDPRFDAATDIATRFRTGSVLAAPIRGEGGSVVGVLMAINRLFDASDLAAFTGAGSRHGPDDISSASTEPTHSPPAVSSRTLSLLSPAGEPQPSSPSFGARPPHSRDSSSATAPPDPEARSAAGSPSSPVLPASLSPAATTGEPRRPAVSASASRASAARPPPPPLGSRRRPSSASPGQPDTIHRSGSHSGARAAPGSRRPDAPAKVFFPFTTADERVMQALVGQAGVEISRAAASRELKRSRDVTAALLDVVHASATQQSLRGLVNRVISATRRLLRPERVSLFLVDSTRGVLVLMNSDDARGLRIRIGDGLAGTVARTGRPLNVPDAYASPLFDPSTDAETGFRTSSVLTVPISLPSPGVHFAPTLSRRAARPHENPPIAVLQAINKADGAPFDDQDVSAMSAFAVEVALALKRRSVETVLMGIIDEGRHKGGGGGGSAEARRRHGIKGQAVSRSAPVSPAGSDDDQSDGGEPLADDDAALLAAAVSLPAGAGAGRGSQPSRGVISPIPEQGSGDGDGSPRRPRRPSLGSGSPKKRNRRATMASLSALKGRPGHRSRRVSSTTVEDVAAQVRARERQVAVSLLTYYDDEQATSRITAAAAGRPAAGPGSRPSAGASWPDGLGAAARGAAMDSRDPLLTWSWDIFSLWDGGSDAGEAGLKSAVASMLGQFALIRRFKVDGGVLAAFVDAVRDRYHENAFHNWRHAVAVMQASFLILCHTGSASMLTFVDIFACLVAALCHDIDHPGTSNGFLIASEDPLALLHNDDAPLERHHSSTAARLLQDDRYDVFAALNPEDRKRVRKVMIGAILATDMSKHMGHVKSLAERAARLAASLSRPGGDDDDDDAGPAARLFPGGPMIVRATSSIVAVSSASSSPDISHAASSAINSLMRRSSAAAVRTKKATRPPAFDRNDPDDRLALVESLVHTADLSGQAFPVPVARRWGDGIIAEFTREASLFESHGLSAPLFITNLRTDQQQASLQSGFIGAMVLPLWERMQDVLQALDEPVQNLKTNLLLYERAAGKVPAGESPEADADTGSEGGEGAGGGTDCEDTPGCDEEDEQAAVVVPEGAGME